METENKNKMKPTKTLTVSLPIGFHMGLEEWIDSQTQHRDEAIYALLAHGLHAVRTIPKTLLKKRRIMRVVVQADRRILMMIQMT